MMVNKIADILSRTNEVTRMKEREDNGTIVKDIDRITPRSGTFNLSSYFSGIETKPGILIF